MSRPRPTWWTTCTCRYGSSSCGRRARSGAGRGTWPGRAGRSLVAAAVAGVLDADPRHRLTLDDDLIRLLAQLLRVLLVLVHVAVVPVATVRTLAEDTH